MAVLVSVVEGEGEVQAVPVLVRRIRDVVAPAFPVEVPPAMRARRGQIVQQGMLEHYVQLAANQAGPDGAILVVLDADDDCPAQLGPALLQRAVSARADMPLAVVLAKREYEAWFLAAAESLRGRRHLRADLDPPPDPEAIRGAKDWLRRRMHHGRKYTPTADQAALTALFDLDLARGRSDSCDKCYREIVRLLTALQSRGGPPI